MHDPAKHGFDLPEPEPPLEFEKVTISKQAHLDRIARSLNIPAADLRYLNPELRNQVTPHEPYSLKVPPGQAERLLGMLDDIQVYVPPVPAHVVHQVRNGESLSVIARRYNTTIPAIVAMNNLKNPAMIRAGAKLKIPTGGAVSRGTSQGPVRHTSTGAGNVLEYIVKKGDSLWDIANRHGTTVRAIKTLNQLPSARLSVGQVLLVPRKEPQV
jgi:membrane-bound lytic murein transglycosylase D